MYNVRLMWLLWIIDLGNVKTWWGKAFICLRKAICCFLCQYILLPGKICWMKSLLKATSNNTAVGGINRSTVVMHIRCLQSKFFLWTECNYYITGENDSYAPWSWEMHGVSVSLYNQQIYRVMCLGWYLQIVYLERLSRWKGIIANKWKCSSVS